ncbi:ThyX-like thymidylate synthase [Mycobacterium phage PetterN]|nr:ThyX-like thymidylate synthase [Mycobacterium phage PetterN]
MKVALIANTFVNDDAIFDMTGYQSRWMMSEGEWERDADELAEFAGRNCYRSFDRPNPATRENVDYLKHILDVGHESVLEHASATFYIEASRSVLTELERHRHLSFSVVSQRYVDPTKLGYHVPPALREEEDNGLEMLWEIASASHRTTVAHLLARGLTRKQAHEAARCLLPNMTNSPMVVTGNHRAWRNVIKQRWHKAADAEIRELAGLLLSELREIAPNTYQDIPEEPYG